MKVKAMWEREDGLIECEGGGVYGRNPRDPRPSRCIKVGQVVSQGTQTSLAEYIRSL